MKPRMTNIPNEDYFSRKAIGGYFELELNQGIEYHKNAIRLNLARNAFELVIKVRRYEKIHLPFYTCETMVQSVKNCGLKHQFYHIDSNFEPVFDFTSIQENEGFLYTNYYGLKDFYIQKLVKICKNLIVDNAQAFYSDPIPGIDVFYSPRKFFGIPDGAYLYTDILLEETLEQDYSNQRFDHLLIRAEQNPEAGYESFVVNERNLSSLPIRKMSHLTQRLLMNIDYETKSLIRKTNFQLLKDGLSDFNKFVFELSDNQVPMVYPFLSPIPNLRQRLIQQRIFVAQYWPNVLEWASPSDLEYRYTQNLVPLPIDQRYTTSDMQYLSSVIREILNESK